MLGTARYLGLGLVRSRVRRVARRARVVSRATLWLSVFLHALLRGR